jgi:hypothetical protein
MGAGRSSASCAASWPRARGRRAQVVVLNGAPTELAMNALSDGRLLLERDAEKRVACEVRTMKEYWDLVPLLEIYRRGGLEGP